MNPYQAEGTNTYGRFLPARDATAGRPYSFKVFFMDLKTIKKMLEPFGVATVLRVDLTVEINGALLIPDTADGMRPDYLYFGSIADLKKLRLAASQPFSFLCYKGEGDEVTGMDDRINLLVVEDREQAMRAFNQVQVMLLDIIRVADSMKELLDASYADVGLQYIVNVASKIFCMPVIVVDTGFKYLAVAGLKDIKNEEFAQEIRMGYIKDQNVESIRSTKLEEDMRRKNILGYVRDDNNEGAGYLVSSVRIHNVEIAHVSIYSNDSNFSEFHRIMLSRFAKLVSIELQKSNFYKENSGIMHSFLLGELLEKGSSNIKNLKERFRLLGYTLKEHLYVLTLKPELKNVQHVQLQVLAEQLRHIMTGVMYVIYENSLVVLISSDTAFDGANEHYESVRLFAAQNELTGGISNQFANVLNTPAYYRQSLDALEFGAMLLHEPGLYRYEDTKIYCIAELCLAAGPVENYCHPGVLRLRDYDEEKGTSLLETLKSYLYFNKSPSHTAKEMNMHRNTLFYTINKIKSIAGIDLEDGDSILNIGLSIKILEYYEKRNQVNAPMI